MHGSFKHDEDQVTSPQVHRITRIDLIVADLGLASAFYEGIGFVRVDPVAGVSLVLRLGAEEIGLIAAAAAAEPYPVPRAANDPWFQHFAVAVADADAAFARLADLGASPISRGGPQRLPPNTGSVVAYKFRDPDGHPLELSFVPGSRWTTLDPAMLFLGIDHSAVVVRDLDAGIAYYTDLGFKVAGRSLNQGDEQDRLDGLDDVQVDIVVMQPRDGGPHLELLHYRSPVPAKPRTIAACDIIATRIVAEADRDAKLRDPDRHILHLTVK